MNCIVAIYTSNTYGIENANDVAENSHCFFFMICPIRKHVTTELKTQHIFIYHAIRELHIMRGHLL